MKIDHEEIKDLIMDEMTGLLTPAEREYLDKLLTDPDVHRYYQHLKGELVPLVEEAEESLRENPPENFRSKMKQRARKRTLAKIAWAILIILFLALEIYFYIRPKKKPSTIGRLTAGNEAVMEIKQPYRLCGE